MMARGIGVMRRRSDGYMNATQILKVAGVDKGRRTRILEKDIVQSGPYEKIQGGYGRFQGTWYGSCAAWKAPLKIYAQDSI
jgi:regulatory protein SWI6